MSMAPITRIFTATRQAMAPSSQYQPLEPHQGQARQDTQGGVHVGEDVLTVGLQGEGVGPFAGSDEPQAQGQIDQRRQEHEEETELQAGEGGGMEQMGPGLPKQCPRQPG